MMSMTRPCDIPNRQDRVKVDIERQQSVGLIVIRPKKTQSDRKSDRLTMFRPKTAQ